MAKSFAPTDTRIRERITRMFEEKIVITPRNPENLPQFTVHRRELQTESGLQFNLQEVTGIINSNEIADLAKNGPVLVDGNIEIQDKQGIWAVKEEVGTILMVVAHGYRLNEQDVIMSTQGPIPSGDVMRAIVKDRETRKEQKRISLFIACDEKNKMLRWDETALSRNLGVIGFAGDANFLTYRAGEKLFRLDASGLNSPFSNPGHTNRAGINPMYSQFYRKKLTLKLE